MAVVNPLVKQFFSACNINAMELKGNLHEQYINKLLHCFTPF